MYLAASNRRTEVVKDLIAAGANVNAAINDGIALHAASSTWLGGRYTEIAKLFIAAGANVNAADNDGITALHYAARDGLPKIAKILIAAGANVNAADKYGWTALHSVAFHEDKYRFSEYTEFAKVLIAAGANVNAADNNGKTPLYKAATKGNTEIFNILKEAGARYR